MPRMEDIESAMVIGSGGIVIAQAAEFDYSGSQALKALREDGIRTVLVNPNCATIQTSLKMADRVYLEPLSPAVVAQIIRREEPDGILFGFGGQTALNLAVQLDRMGILKDEGVRVLGSPIDTIRITEDRGLFKRAMERAHVPIPLSEPAYSVEEALSVAKDIGYPVIIRTAYTLGGGGSGVAYDPGQLRAIVRPALLQSLEHQVLVEQYLEHWKEIE
ncbi:TPA: carbamoyl phosphate synthase large subunit, partial [Candidatus Bathyarchaeota archaeon]|nr:carbamoyl phosphate synthase large subunit [Candidatus Bathyarchaeota archaeon]